MRTVSSTTTMIPVTDDTERAVTEALIRTAINQIINVLNRVESLDTIPTLPLAPYIQQVATLSIDTAPQLDASIATTVALADHVNDLLDAKDSDGEEVVAFAGPLHLAINRLEHTLRATHSALVSLRKANTTPPDLARPGPLFAARQSVAAALAASA